MTERALKFTWLHGYNHLCSLPLESWLGFIPASPFALPWAGVSLQQSHVTRWAAVLAMQIWGFKPHGRHMLWWGNRGSWVQWQHVQSERKGCMVIHLERLNPDMPEREASSMSGVTIFSVMSVSTVKVGSTMKSMKPEQKHKQSQAGKTRIYVELLLQWSQTTTL